MNDALVALLLLAALALPMVPSPGVALGAPAPPGGPAQWPSLAAASPSSAANPRSPLQPYVTPWQGGVGYTLLPLNGSVATGRTVPAIPGEGVVYDSVDNRVFTAPGPNGDVGVLNASSGRVIGISHAYVSIESMAFDPVHDLVLIAGDSGVTVINGSTLQVVSRYIKVGNGACSIVVDTQDNRAYVSSNIDNQIWAIATTNESVVGRALPVNSTPSTLLYDPVNDRIYLWDAERDVLAINGSAGTWDTSVNWSVPGGAYSMALAPGRQWLYAGGRNITVINATTGKIVDSGLTPSGVSGLAYYPPTDSVLVTTGPSYNFSRPDVYAINVSTNNISGSGTIEPEAFEMAYDSTDGLLYIKAGAGLGGSLGTYLAVMDPRVSLSGRDIQLYYALTASAYDERDGNVYVIDNTGQNGTGPSSVLVVNGTTRQFQDFSYPVRGGAAAIVYDDANGRLYVANIGGDTVSEIDPANRSVRNINMSAGFEPVALGVDTLRNMVYVVGMRGGNLTLINGTSGSVVPTSINVGAVPGNGTFFAAQYDPLSDEVYVGNCLANNVTIINASSRTVVGTAPTGWCPNGFAVDPADGTVWVANAESNNVTVLNGSTHAAVGSVWVGYLPDSIVYDPANRLMYVAIGLSDNVTPIDPATQQFVGHGIWVRGGGYVNVVPQGLSYDAARQEVDVPTEYANGMYAIGNIPAPTLNESVNRTDVDQPVEFVTNVTGGTVPFTYTYSGLPVGCTTQNASTLLCSPRVAGNYTVVVTVEDINGYQGQGHVELQVLGPPTGLSLSVSPGITDAELPVSISLNSTGGLGPLTISYSGLPPDCPQTNRTQFNCTPSTPGLYLIAGIISDSLGTSASASATLQVLARPTVSVFVAEPSTVAVMATTTLLVVVQGGVGPFSYLYSNLPNGCTTANESELQCVPTTTGAFQVGLLVKDSEGVTANATAALTVFGYGPPPISPPPSVEVFLASPNLLTLGNSTTFVLLLTGGMSPVTENFTGLPPGCAKPNATVAQFTCTPGTVGNYSVTVTVDDAMERKASGTTSLAVREPVKPAPLPLIGPAPVPWSTVALSAGVGGVAGLGLALAVPRMWRSRSKPTRTGLQESP